MKILFLLPLLILPVLAQSNDSKDKGGAVSHKATESPDQVRDYWTPERMKNAKPKEMPTPTPMPQPGKSEPAPSGQPGSTEGKPPSQNQ